ncbi:hypothetical protein MMC15_005686 [Xylographa vitiligo]|nr:hypothetical protein [Xylographa vitiligo]
MSYDDPALRAEDGNDGLWSSFSLGVGTPLQYVRLLVSTTAVQPWVVVPEGCTPQDPSDCPLTRGGLFRTNESSTWHDEGDYTLLFEENLGFEGNGDFGLDTLSLGLPGTGAPTIKQQVVAGIAAKDFYIGILGLGPEPTNLTTMDDPQESLLSTLKQQNLLPSLSWAYTAGAHYRLKGVDGSLTLGGYDTSRFIQSPVSCNFADDISRNIVVGIKSITTTAGNSSDATMSLLPNGFLAFVDAGVSHIWLPLEVCQAFETTFGLIYDPTTELYLINDTLHDILVTRNASITFQLANDLTSVNTVSITLPYAGFDLELTPNYPGIMNQTRYFPIRRAANDSQNTLGRTFLQEAYLIADYERSNFSINPVIFADSYEPNLQAILPPSNSSNTTTSTSHSPLNNPTSTALTAGAIAGIVVSAFSVAVILAVGIFVGVRKRRTQWRLQRLGRKRNGSNNLVLEKAELHNSDIDLSRPKMGELQEEGSATPELPSTYQQKAELEALGRQRLELQGCVNVYEMEVPPRKGSTKG